MQYQEQQESQAAGSLHLWPRPLSAGALGIVKAMLGGALVLILLLQLLGTAGIGKLVDNLFALLFLLSLSGPIRSLFRRGSNWRGSNRGGSPEQEPE